MESEQLCMEEDGLVWQKFFTASKKGFICLGNGLTLDQHLLVPASAVYASILQNMPVFFYSSECLNWPYKSFTLLSLNYLTQKVQLSKASQCIAIKNVLVYPVAEYLLA